MSEILDIIQKEKDNNFEKDFNSERAALVFKEIINKTVVSSFSIFLNEKNKHLEDFKKEFLDKNADPEIKNIIDSVDIVEREGASLIYFSYLLFKNKFGEDFINKLDEELLLIKISSQKEKSSLLHLIKDKGVDFFNDKYFNGLDLLNSFIISDNTKSIQYLLDMGLKNNPIEHKNKESYTIENNPATFFVKSLETAKLLNDYNFPWFISTYNNAISLLFNNEYLETKQKPLAKYIVQNVVKENPNKKIKAISCLQFFYQSPSKKYFKKFYTVSKPNDVNTTFYYDNRNNNMLEHMALNLLEKRGAFTEEKIKKTRILEQIIDYKSTDIKTKTDENISTLAILNMVPLETGYQDSDLKRALFHLKKSISNKNKDHNFRRLEVEDFLNDISVYDKFNFFIKEEDHFLPRSVNLYSLYIEQHSITQEEKHEMLNIMLDYLIYKETKETYSEKEKQFIDEYTLNIKQSFYAKTSEQKELFSYVSEISDRKITNKYFEYQMASLKQIAERNNKNKPLRPTKNSLAEENIKFFINCNSIMNSESKRNRLFEVGIQYFDSINSNCSEELKSLLESEKIKKQTNTNRKFRKRTHTL